MNNSFVKRCWVAAYLGAVLTLSAIPAQSSWTVNGTAICSNNAAQRGAVAITDGDGGAIVCWMDTRDDAGNIYAQRVDAMGVTKWSNNGISVCSAAGKQETPAIVTDMSGGAIIVWSDWRSGSAPDLYVQRIGGSGTTQWTTNGVAICTAVDDQTNPLLVTDGAGGAIVQWKDRRGASGSDIYVQRVSTSGNSLWTANGLAVCLATDNQFDAALVSDLSGGAVIAWADVRGGVDLDIYSQRVSGDGLSQWTSNGVALCTAFDNQSGPALVPDATGGAIVGWVDSRYGIHNDIFAQRVSNAGVVLWPSNGIGVATGASDQSSVAMVTDGVGGAIVCWQDNRWDTMDIFGQRITLSGLSSWTSNGVPICTSSGYQYAPVACSDSASGAIIVWQDAVCGLSCEDLYAMRVAPNGVPLWQSGGVPLTVAPNRQRLPSIVSDEWGGVIAAWEDARNGEPNVDVYAVRVSPAGMIPTAVGPNTATPGIVISGGSPNPFSERTFIDFELSHSSSVTLMVYDAAGRLISEEPTSIWHAGKHRLYFDGHGTDGRRLASGVYFYRIIVDGASITRKLVLTR